jgi:NifU-like protein involved in Fe-S cluster formation/bacterioferritin-associated ferredoxin
MKKVKSKNIRTKTAKKNRTTSKKKPDVVNKFTGNSWAYSDEVREHFFNPKNLLWESPDAAKYDAEGIVGSPACGDVMRVWLNIDPKKDRIREFKWRTFGCASAIAATSILSVMITEKGGMKLDKAMRIRPQDIMKRLGGLPDRKIHCSVLGDKALRAAINDWFKKTRQWKRIVVEGTRILDPNTKVTEADIEEAVLEGATTLEAVQKRTKVGIGYAECLPAVEELIRFYREKYCL